jgi:hypothetical protein
MGKLILMSVLIATVAIPARLSREKNARKAFRKAMLYVVVFNFIYLLCLLFVVGRF